MHTKWSHQFLIYQSINWFQASDTDYSFCKSQRIQTETKYSLSMWTGWHWHGKASDILFVHQRPLDQCLIYRAYTYVNVVRGLLRAFGFYKICFTLALNVARASWITWNILLKMQQPFFQFVIWPNFWILDLLSINFPLAFSRKEHRFDIDL